MACSQRPGPRAAITYINEACGIHLTQADWHHLRSLAEHHLGHRLSTSYADAEEVQRVANDLIDKFEGTAAQKAEFVRGFTRARNTSGTVDVVTAIVAHDTLNQLEERPRRVSRQQRERLEAGESPVDTNVNLETINGDILSLSQAIRETDDLSERSALLEQMSDAAGRLATLELVDKKSEVEYAYSVGAYRDMATGAIDVVLGIGDERWRAANALGSPYPRKNAVKLRYDDSGAVSEVGCVRKGVEDWRPVGNVEGMTPERAAAWGWAERERAKVAAVVALLGRRELASLDARDALKEQSKISM